MAATDHAPAPTPAPPTTQFDKSPFDDLSPTPYVCLCKDGPHRVTDFHDLEDGFGLICTWCKSSAVPVGDDGLPINLPAELDTLTL